MTTITLEVPKELVSEVVSWKREQWLKTLREYKRDQEDIKLVEDEMKKPQKSIFLKDYVKKCGK